MSEASKFSVGLVKLGSVAHVIMGQSPAGADCNRARQGTPLLNGPTEFGLRYPMPAQWTIAPTKFAEPNDVLFCVRGSTTGRMNIADQRYCAGRGIAAIRGKVAADTEFIYQAITANLDELLALTTGTVFPNISGLDLRRFEIPWPEANERHRIAAVLGTLDAAIEKATRVRDLVAVAAQSLLASSPSTCMVREIAITERTQWYPEKNITQTVDHYSLPAFDTVKEPDRVAASEIASNKLIVHRPSVLFSRLNPDTNRTWLCLPSTEVDRSVCSTEYAVLIPAGEVTAELIWASVGSGELGGQLAAATTGTSASHQRVSEDTVLAALIPDPRALNAADQAEAQLYVRSYIEKGRELRVLRETRRVLLPLLLTGDLRVAAPTQLVKGVS